MIGHLITVFAFAYIAFTVVNRLAGIDFKAVKPTDKQARYVNKLLGKH